MFWMMISWCYFWQSLEVKFESFVTDPGSDWSHLVCPPLFFGCGNATLGGMCFG